MLLDKIQTDLKVALKAKDESLVSTLRFLLAEIQNRQIALRGPQGKTRKFGDEDVILAIRLQVKQHKESIEFYQKGKRDDLVAKERQELEYLNKYLPQQLSAPEIEKIAKVVIEQVKPAGPQDFGKVMGVVMGKVKGQAEGNQVAEVVKKLL